MSQDVSTIIQDDVNKLNEAHQNKPTRNQVTAYRKDGNGYRTTIVDLSLVTGEPMLPPDTTVDPKPDLKEGMMLTVEGRSWKFIPIVYDEPTFDELKLRNRHLYETWKEAYMNAPFVANDGIVFHGDAASRTAIESAVLAGKNYGTYPQVWVAFNNVQIENPSEVFINNLGRESYKITQERFAVTVKMKNKLNSVTTPAGFEALIYPEPDTFASLNKK